MYCKNRLFMEIVFNTFHDRFVSFFGGFGSRFFVFLIPRGTISASQEHPRGVFRNVGGHPGGPWEQQDRLELLVYRILFDLGMAWGPVYISFLNSRSSKFHIFSGLVFRSFFYRFLNRNFDTRDFQIMVFA